MCAPAPSTPRWHHLFPSWGATRARSWSGTGLEAVGLGRRGACGDRALRSCLFLTPPAPLGAFWAACPRRPGVGRGVRTDVPQAIHGTRRGSPGRVTSVRGSSPAGCGCPAVAHSGFASRLSHGSSGGLRVPRRVRIPAEGGTRFARGLCRGRLTRGSKRARC
jgi:hypothetical protein